MKDFGEKIKEFFSILAMIIENLEKLTINIISLLGWIAMLIFALNHIK